MWQLHLTVSNPQNTENQRVCLHSIQQSSLLWKKNAFEPKELLHQQLINYKDTNQNMRQMDVHSTSFNHHAGGSFTVPQK